LALFAAHFQKPSISTAPPVWICWVNSCMLHVQQHVLDAHSNVCEGFGSSKSRYLLCSSVADLFRQVYNVIKLKLISCHVISITMPISITIPITQQLSWQNSVKCYMYCHF